MNDGNGSECDFIDYDPSFAMTPVKTNDLPWGNGGF